MSIRVDPKHGVNPSVEQCFYCLGDKGLILWGELTPEQRKALGTADGAAPRTICINKEPCTECEAHMARGIILISAADESMGSQNPHRTGSWVVVTEDAIKRMINDKELCDHVLNRRMAFVPDQVWDMVGLPRPA